MKTADNVEIFSGMTVWLDGWLAGIVWGEAHIDDDGNLTVSFGPTTTWNAYASDLYSTDDAAIAALMKGGDHHGA